MLSILPVYAVVVDLSITEAHIITMYMHLALVQLAQDLNSLSSETSKQPVFNWVALYFQVSLYRVLEQLLLFV